MNAPDSFVKHEAACSDHQQFMKDGKYFVIFSNGELGIGVWHHVIGWINVYRDKETGEKFEVKYFYLPSN